jgi:hypothetical protein
MFGRPRSAAGAGGWVGIGRAQGLLRFVRGRGFAGCMCVVLPRTEGVVSVSVSVCRAVAHTRGI